MALSRRTGVIGALVVCLLLPVAPGRTAEPLSIAGVLRGQAPSAVAGREAATQYSAAELAQQILDLRAAGRIGIYDYSARKEADRADRSLASQQLVDIAAGRRANLSRRCHDGRLVRIRPDIRILRFLADLGMSHGAYTINVLFGQCHSRGSLHYRGQAVDLRCGLVTTDADASAIMFGIKRNLETCRQHAHWHYSVGGR
ncbi:hypothetical protein [Cryptosporangium minutisporangium]|uniref:Uncharacterized protein n=1 Tax=Cryptosporangium minutisporangium TaxID=113569 RepID=A0ABP6T7C4_9ACTN